MKQIFLKQRKSIIYTLGIVSFLTSCEGYRCAEGVICGSETKEVIDSVKCVVISANSIEIEFSKVGYKTKIVTNPSKDSIYLEKEN